MKRSCWALGLMPLYMAVVGLLPLAVQAQTSSSETAMQNRAVQQEANTSSDSSEWDEVFDDEWDVATDTSSALTISGFLEATQGYRWQSDDAVSTRQTLSDVRARINLDYLLSTSALSFKSDLWFDGVQDKWQAQVRELAWQGNLSGLGEWGNAFDVKIGQQVLTWGTGDYVFLNDLFPKDYPSFFAGRSDEYLKAPSASIKLSGYFSALNIDVVVTPEFEPDIAINGDVFSFFSAQAGQNIAPGFSVSKEHTPNSPELAVRLHRNFNSTQWALYGYRGYYKQPLSTTEQGELLYSRLNVVGASVVMPLYKGIFNAEYAYYHSVDDSRGRNPRIPNSQQRFLLGYNQELAPNLNGGAQWYSEVTQHYSQLMDVAYYPEHEQAQVRHWLTARLTWLALRQTLTINGFLFYSPTDNDGYLKAELRYTPTDNWQFRVGINGFRGRDDDTFWGQFENGSHGYMALRYFY